MTEHVKVIARRPATATSRSRTSTTVGRLPEEFLTEQVRRLALFGAVGAGLWTFGLTMDFIFLRIAASTFVPSATVTSIEVLGVVAGVSMFVYARYVDHPSQTKMDVAIGYMLLNACAVALLNALTFLPREVPAMYVSWVAVVILIFSIIAPTTPRKMLIASMAAASTDPLAVWLAHLNGAVTPSIAEVVALFLPNYACAVVATLPSRVFQRLGRRLREAQELGSYQLVELLGQGGMGEVWRAEHRLLARHAAVKLVRPEVLGGGNEDETRLALRRFDREARATAALSSPHTIQVFDFGTTEDGSFYYVMELLTGRDLESLVRDYGPMHADRAVFLLRQVCHSLADAHARGLVHRDIKPANIYACRMGLEYDFVKVLDFGLVKFSGRGARDQTVVTAEHRTTGTPAYMAPEVILGEADVDRRADVYAIGCVAYFLLTGQLVFEADTSMKMLLQHVQAQPVAPSERTELRIPRELDDLVLACLQKNPDDRPQSAEALFRMVCQCRECDNWDQDRATAWWQTHLPDLTGPLTVGDARADASSGVEVFH
jgi:serine/threonine-protein kinase